MIRIFGRVGMVAWGACVLLIVFALRVLPSHAFPLTADLQRFGFGACELPCYAGVRVGITSIDDVELLLAANIPAQGSITRQGSSVPIVQTDGGAPVNSTLFFLSRQSLNERNLISVNVLTGNGTVTIMSISTAIPLQNLLNDLGAPTCAYVDRTTLSAPIMRLAWALDDGVMVQAEVPMFRRRWSIRSYAIGVNITSSNAAPVIFVDSQAMIRVGKACTPDSYIGFASLNRYLDLQRRLGGLSRR